MKLKIRYENEIQTIELDVKATEKMWVSLSLEGEGLSQQEREELIQKEWNEKFNKADYNKFKRWVTSEILPSIRRHGMYVTDELIANPDLAIAAFTALIIIILPYRYE